MKSRRKEEKLHAGNKFQVLRGYYHAYSTRTIRRAGLERHEAGKRQGTKKRKEKKKKVRKKKENTS